jgi:glycine/D-amino acid oxidase-like deaminating enzyme
MLGMTLGAVTGELVGDLLTDGRSSILDAFRPARFRW